VVGVVGAGVGQLEPLGHVVVELHGAELPGAADRVGHVQVDLRPVERAVARVEVVLEALVDERLLEPRLGTVPHLLGADALLRAGRELQPRLEAERVVDREAEVQAALDLLGDLLLGAEDVGVVLRDVADAQQTVQRAARLVAVNQPGLRVADRQVAVGVAPVVEQLHVGRAVHRLQAHRMALEVVREVHVVAVNVPVAGLLPEADVVEDRRLDLAVAAVGVLGAPEVLELVEHRLAGRLPERRARAEVAEHEQAEVASEPAVVTRPRLLEPLQVELEVLLGMECGPVDAGEHLAVGVPAPVSARDRQQLERLHALGRRRVRAAAEVGEAVVGVERDRRDALVADQVLDQLDLVVLALAHEAVDRVAGGNVLAHERLVGLDVLAHLGLDRLEVGIGDRDAGRELEVVVEALADRRPD
jgi:hypothetical protein